MSNPKGGRGNVAPYNTVIVRVPEEIMPLVQAITLKYKELKLAQKEKEIQQFLSVIESAIVSENYNTNKNLPTMEEAKEIASKLISQKKSAKATVEKFLQILYKQQ